MLRRCRWRWCRLAEFDAKLFAAFLIGGDAVIGLVHIIALGLDDVGRCFPTLLLRDFLGLTVFERIDPFPFWRDPFDRRVLRRIFGKARHEYDALIR